MTTPQDFLSDGAKIYEDKNEDYGDSWRKVGEFLHSISGPDGITLESKEDFISFGLFTRRLDKVARAFNGEFVADEMHFESVKDSHTDEMTYSAMAATIAEQRDNDSE